MGGVGRSGGGGGGASRPVPRGGITVRGRTTSSYNRGRDRSGGLVTNIERARARYRALDRRLNQEGGAGSAAAARRARRARRRPSQR